MVILNLTDGLGSITFCLDDSVEVGVWTPWGKYCE